MGGPARVITDKAVFGFDPVSKRMRLDAIHPNTTLEDVLSNMAFQPVVPRMCLLPNRRLQNSCG